MHEHTRSMREMKKNASDHRKAYFSASVLSSETDCEKYPGKTVRNTLRGSRRTRAARSSTSPGGIISLEASEKRVRAAFEAGRASAQN